MHVQSFTYSRAGGWSIPALPDWDGPSTLILAFADTAYADDPTPFAALRARYPRSVLLGCSSAGEICGTRVDDGTVAVAVARFERGTTLRAASAPIASPDRSEEAGRALGERLAGDGLAGVFVLSDGLGVNGTALAKGLNGGLPAGVVVTGGLAGDGARFQRTWVLDGDGARAGRVAAVGLYGSRVRIGHGSKGGWDIFGPERVITRAEGNVLYELDGAPALALYKTYLGERAAGLPATALLFPLEIRERDDDDKRLVRTVLSVDEAAQSLTFAGDVPPGWRAQLMRANFDRLVGGAADAARMTSRGGGDAAVLSVAISCVGRRLVLGERTEEEVEATLDALPRGTHQVGFYSYGEISPYADGPCDLHNQTMTLTTFTEA